jgi:hypothetical protein
LRIYLINNFSVEGVLISIERVRVNDFLERSHREIGHEFHCTEVIIVTHVTVEACNISDELNPFIICDASLKSS